MPLHSTSLPLLLFFPLATPTSPEGDATTDQASCFPLPKSSGYPGNASFPQCPPPTSQHTQAVAEESVKPLPHRFPPSTFHFLMTNFLSSHRPPLPIASSSSLLTACLLKSFSEFLSRPLPSSDPGRAASSRRGGRGPRGRSEKGSAPVHIGTNLTQDRRENTCFSF